MQGRGTGSRQLSPEERRSYTLGCRNFERGETDVIGPSVFVVPMMRLEKILLDRSSGELPSLAERFEQQTGRPVQDVFAES